MGDESKTNEATETQDARKKVFVIKAKPNGLKSAENFLKNRSWEIISSHEMKIALAALFRSKFDYALIGVDHPHGHILKLPEIVAQTLKIPIILFAENMSPQAAHMLRAARSPYVLFPPVSGPAIERMLLRIEKDRLAQTQQKANDLRMAESGGNDSTSIRISEGSSTSDTTSISASGSMMADSAHMGGAFSEADIAKLFEGEGLSPMMGATQDGIGMGSNPGVQYQKGASAHSLTEQEDPLPNNLMAQLQAQQNGAPGSTNGFGTSGFGSGGANGFAQSGFGKNSSGQNGLGQSGSQQGSGFGQSGFGANGLGAGGLGQNGFSGADGASEQSAHSAAMAELQRAQAAAAREKGFSNLPKGSSIDLSLWPADAKPPGERKGDQPGVGAGHSASYTNTEEYRRQVEHHSVLMNGTVHALSKASTSIENATPVTIAPTMSSNVAVFAVDAAGMSGMIVCAYGNDRVIDRKFSADLRDHLLRYMQNNGIDFKIEDVVNLSVQQVAFEEWSEKEALFLRKSLHAGCELALGFFINATPQARLEPSVHTDMLKVNIDEIRADHSLGFDVYLYFPENGKYLRYVGKDGNLSGKQWDRLTAGGITELHVKKEAESEISRYRMKNFLNDKIADFQNGKKAA